MSGDRSRHRLIVFDGVGLVLGGRPVIQGLRLSIGAAEFVCVIGPSGCGKTTALRLVADLVRQTSGAVRFDGKAVTGPRRDIAIVFQVAARRSCPGAQPPATCRRRWRPPMSRNPNARTGLPRWSPASACRTMPTSNVGCRRLALNQRKLNSL